MRSTYRICNITNLTCADYLKETKQVSINCQYFCIVFIMWLLFLF